MSVRARFDDLVAGECFELADPRGTLVARAVAEVPGVIEAAEQAVRGGGLYAAGFVAYEAAPAFDPALSVRTVDRSGTLPLAWFGLFARLQPTSRPEPPTAVPAGRWTLNTSEKAHAESVESIREEIAAGWTYQANLTTSLSCAYEGDPFLLYRQLATAQGGAYHAYLETDGFAIACASPELFFSLENGTISSRPMKGTIARGRFPVEDKARAAALLASAKEQAENLMIVDLVRNDLGRIARVGTVRVPELFAVERYPTVWQLTSTVEAEIAPATGLGEIFSAVFPCGSVTGAPKASTMAILSGLEGSPRGVYCGAVGLVASRRGQLTARFAVAIRTATVDKATGEVRYGVGGGVTYDSNPRREWEELLEKAAVLTYRPRPVALFETMRFSAGEGLRNRDRHLARLASSAEYFGVPYSREAALAALEDATASREGTWRVRLQLSEDGQLGTQAEPFAAGLGRLVRLEVDDEPVPADDARLFHKTTDRSVYDLRRHRHPRADDVVLVNAAGEVTETLRANLAVRLEGRWWTPPVTCGLLAGVERGRLLDEGRLVERVMSRADLQSAEALATVSSLRGWLPARLTDG